MGIGLCELLKILDIEQLDANLFRGTTPITSLPRVYGGQVVAQALVAALRTVPDDRNTHSLHAYFLRPGDNHKPLLYYVDPIRDGGSFTSRNVTVKQDGKAVFSATMSFQKPEKGLEHQTDMPEVPPPEELESDKSFWDRFKAENPTAHRSFSADLDALEFRAISRRDPISPQPMEPIQGFWFRTSEPLPDRPRVHEVILTFASDLHFMGTALRPHPYGFGSKEFFGASLDHAIWFHAEFRADEWLYYHMDSTRASGGRGFNRGSIYSRDGVLVASTIQEGLIRIKGMDQG